MGQRSGPPFRGMFMQAVLVMFRSDGERRSFSVTRDITVIGRREDCDLRIPLGDVSRKHCRIIRDGEELRVEDLGSSNGTFHNGQRVQEAPLSPGDSIQVGPVVFVLQLDGVPADEDLHPVAAQPVAGPGHADHEMSPLSPTAQSDAGDLDVPELPDSEDAAFNAMLEDAAPHAGHEELELEDLDKE